MDIFDFNLLLFSDLIALNCGQRKLLRRAFHSWSRHTHWNLQPIIEHNKNVENKTQLQYQLRWKWRYVSIKVQIKIKISPVPALEQPRVCCSTSLGQLPRTSDNCLQHSDWIKSQFSVEVATFAVSISWTVVSRLTDCHHLLAALFAKAHLVMIRQYMIMRFIFVLWFFLLGGFVFWNDG